MENRHSIEKRREAGMMGTGPIALVTALSAIIAGGAIYTVSQHKQARELTEANQALSANMSQLQTQVRALNDKLNEAAATQAAEARPTARPSAMNGEAHPGTGMHRKAVHRLARRQPVEDPRVSRLESQLSDQQKQLASTRDDMDKARQDLQGKIDSTRDELNGSIKSTHDELDSSIARTHDEVVALQKRGERNIYEFHLNKSKAFQRVGPVQVSLRKVNFKHQRFNLALMVDDFGLDKKNVNLYEPIWITEEDRPQPIELVINHIEKDRITGYLSEPKYRKADLTSSAAPSQPATPAPVPVAAASDKPSPLSPK